MKRILLTSIFLLIPIIVYTKLTPSEINKIEKFKPVIDELLNKGVDTNFVYSIVTDNRTNFNDKYCNINVLGFLAKADYSKHYNERAIQKTKSFHKSNKKILDSAEKRYGVSSEVIASVLWVETRHGAYTGYNHIASVYLSLALTKQQEFIDENIKNLRKKYDGNKEELIELEKKIISRSKKKSNWAIEQLIAMEELSKIYPVDILELKGSWAGAFGYSQFLPSSYLQWAADGNDDGMIDLFNMDDAIFSVANYLKTNGWGETEEEQRKAVYHYNNSSAYVDAVLKLADLISN